MLRNSPLMLTAFVLPLALSGLMLGPELNDDRTGKADWPQWRGANRDAAGQSNILHLWPADGPEVLWRIPAGDGFSSVSVAGGRLFTMWDEGEDQFLISLDASTGSELWRRRIGSSFANGYGNGPRSTPTVDDKIVFAVSSRGVLHAVNAAGGQPIWHHDLAAEYGAKIPHYGYSSSPLIEDSKLIVEVGGKTNFAFVAFDKKTGRVVWTSQSDTPAYSSPLAFTVDGIRQVVFFSASGLFAVSPDDGELLWNYPWESRCPSTGLAMNLATPIFIAPDKVYLSGGFGTNTGSAVLKIISSGEKFQVETLWRSEKMRNQVNSALLHGNFIYGFDIAIFKCIDVLTGEEKWKARGFERGSLIKAGDFLIVLGEKGNLAIGKASPEGFEETAAAQILTGKSWTMPTLADGRLYLRNQSEVVSLNMTGQQP